MFGHQRKRGDGPDHTQNDYPQKERRWMQRLTVSSLAFLCNQDDAYQQCTITSINANGMLMLADNTHLGAGCFTTVELLLNCEDGVKYQTETVRVVHADNSCVAVAFVEYSFSHLRTIQNLFHNGKRPHSVTASDHHQAPAIASVHRHR